MKPYCATFIRVRRRIKVYMHIYVLHKMRLTCKTLFYLASGTKCVKVLQFNNLSDDGCGAGCDSSGTCFDCSNTKYRIPLF